MNLQKKFTETRQALVESIRIIRIMQDHLKAADDLAKAAFIVSMYARSNHPHIGDYADTIDPPLKAYQALREPCAASREEKP